MSGQTYVTHIDVFGDYIAMTGNFDDDASNLKTPFIVLASIAIPEKYYWDILFF
jgi:hypothetical protein